MATSFYFQSGIPGGRRSEQTLVEDLVIECLKIYGFDTYYIPRVSVNEDEILNEDTVQKYTNAYPIEMYMENVDGFEGEGELLTKFGLEIRSTATLVVARRRWEDSIGVTGNTVLPNRPAEGDIVYFPLTKSFFEIKKVDATDPFFQVGKLYVYKLQVELMQYSSEVFDTGITEIDAVVEDVGQDLQNWEVLLETGYKLKLEYESPSNLILDSFNTIDIDKNADNEHFDAEATDILDFTERNPFGEVYN